MTFMSSLFSLEPIEKPYAAQVLLLLHREGPMNKGMIYDRFGIGTVTLQDRISELRTANLLTETKEIKRWTSRRVELTPDGETVAEYLEKIEPVIERAASVRVPTD